MTKTTTDEMLVAYLDGELSAQERAGIEAALAADEAAAARLRMLGRSKLPYAESFERLLAEAPRRKLDAMLAEIHSAIPASPPARVSSRRAFLATALICLGAGVALDRGILAIAALTAKQDEAAAWRNEVAEYLALYTQETLHHMTIDEAKRVAQLQRASERLGLQLDPFAMSLGGLEMRRAQVLEYDGKPLGQIMYLDPAHGPVALCILASSTGPTRMHTEQRSGLNLIYWSSDTHDFVMAARTPIDNLMARAREIRYDLADRNQA